MDSLDLRCALTLCTAMATCFVIWIVGAMWQQAQTVSGSAANIASPADSLWLSQHFLFVLLFQPMPKRVLILCCVVVSVILPIWLLLILIDLLDLLTVFRVHVTAISVSVILTGSAVLLCRIPSIFVRHSVAVGLQVLYISVLFGLTSRSLSWVF